MGCQRSVRRLWSTVLVCFSVFGLASRTDAQPPPSNPNEMCGTGETFTVNLKGTSLGIDDSAGLFRIVDAPAVARDDQITLPKGCRIYAFLISGFGDNKDYDHIVFYKVAAFVARNNGYVHVGWWNNLTAPYMERPLHAETITIQKTLLGIPLGDPVVIFPGPKSEGIPDTFLNANLDLPKANPDEDYQLLSDARAVLKAVRSHNPDALIIVVGHSMGGNAVARLGAMPDVPIDLLAPIDPVGNRDTPRDDAGSPKFNWTRWRATHDFRGWKVRDCQRMSEPSGSGLCRNFGTLFSPSFRCTTRGDWLPDPPLIGSRQPLLCPGSHEDPGPLLIIGANVRHLYHRWQLESFWPVDFNNTYRFGRPAAFPVSTSNILSPNYQAAVLENPVIAIPGIPQDPNKTCSTGIDPRDERFNCNPADGHGEIIGVRVDGLLQTRVRPGLKLTNWPPKSSTFTPGDRRERLIQLAIDGDQWPYRPENPDLCLVCDDIIAITEHLMAQQSEEQPEDTVPPASRAAFTPEANAQGWFNEDVVVSVSATDAHSAVQAIHLTLSGAQVGTTTTPGSSAETTISAEGHTTVSFFARDEAGNDESPNSLDIRIDKTAPHVSAVTDVLPNAYGWFGSPVVVRFPASDEAAGSGLASSSPDVTVGIEGAGQEILGAAEDQAGNSSSALITLNVDLTPPATVLDTRTPSANAAGWNNSPVTVTWQCTDALSGVLASTDVTSVVSEGAAQSVTGTCRDKAGHVTTGTLAGINIDLTGPGVTLTTPTNGAIYLLNAAVPVVFACTDALSGVASCVGTLPSGALLDTSWAGPKTFAVTAADAAANATTVAHTYSVRYNFTGFASPIGSGINQVNAGRTVPVRFSLLDANGAFISNLAAFASLSSSMAPCESGEVVELATEAESSGETTIRYDADANQFIYNWKTEKAWAGTCRILRLGLADGTEHIARFRFK